ncbi:MAG: MFS transporter [Chloroflexi bacterium]|nr:MFS transporter [Chloroflexota bacterium]
MPIARAFYFIFFAASAFLLPFFTLYYQSLGLSGNQIGFLSGILPLMTLFGASIWGAISDVTHRYKAMLIAAIAGTCFSILLMLEASSFLWLIPAVTFYAFFYAPIMPLTDNAVVTLLQNRRAQYGKERVWGSYGWGVAGIAAGALIQRLGLLWAFYGFLLLFLVLFLLALRFPMPEVKLSSHFWVGVRTMWSNTRWLLFLFVALIEGMSLNIFMNYLFLHLKSIEAGGAIMGLSLTVATISEIPIFLGASRLLRRWGAVPMLLLSLLMTIARAFGYVAVREPWQVLPVSLLHGPSFGLMWVAGVAYAAENAPPGLGATAQGVFSGVTFGLGAALGAFIGGFLYERYNAVAAFHWAGWTSLIALFLFLWLNREAVRERLPS